jgi:16S rRNA (cytosine967-C5)-methyltransferase
MTGRKLNGAAKTPLKNRTAEVSAARKAAFNILLAVERGHSHSDDLLRAKTVNALSAPDRNLATALVLGVLRWQIQLDHEFQALLSHPDAKLDPEVLIALRLGVFQLLHMNRIPARAVLSESVELVKQSGHRFASGMVNAVLRKLAKTPQVEMARLVLKGHGFSRAKRQVETEPALQATERISALKGHDFSRAVNAEKSTGPLGPEGRFSGVLFENRSLPTTCLSAEEMLPEESAAELALSLAYPAWMVERWINFYGFEATRAICRHGQSQPVLAVRLTSPDVEAELTAVGIVLEAGELLAVARTVVSGDVTATEAFRAGRVRLQDEGSQLVAECSTSLGQKVKSVLDACAAPGGKTLILAERNPAARIVACEASAPRLEQLQKRLAFLGERVECRRADAAGLTEDSVFDLALADVPCSGTGTLGRNPEIRHRLRPEDLLCQAKRQKAILAAALRAVRPGGRVVYSTCSLEPEENEQVVAAVLSAMPNASVVSLGGRIGELLGEGILTDSGAERLRGGLTPEGALRLLPGVFHTDGFFIAMIERTATGAIPKTL